MTSEKINEAQEAVDFLLEYSCDTIASYSLHHQYDPKKIASAIDKLFGEHGLLGTSMKYLNDNGL